MARQSYLRPYGAENVRLMEPAAPLTERLATATGGGRPPSRAPGMPGVLAEDPRALLQRQFSEGLQGMASEQMRSSQGPPAKRSLGTRLLDILELAGTQELPESDPYNLDVGGSAATHFLRSFSNVRGGLREMSRQQQLEQERASGTAARTDLARAQAEYYRSRAAGGQTSLAPRGQPLSERIQLEDVRHGHRMEEIGARDTGLLDRLRYARSHPVPRAGGTTSDEGKISPAERVVITRYQRALQGGASAAAKLRAAGVQDPSTGKFRDPTPEELSQATHEGARLLDPSFSADSAMVEGRINPRIYGPDYQRQQERSKQTGQVGTLMQRLLQGIMAAGSQNAPGAAAAPAAAGPAQGPDEETLDEQEVQDAVDNIAGLDDEEARDELDSAGYTPAQIERILASR